MTHEQTLQKLVEFILGNNLQFKSTADGKTYYAVDFPAGHMKRLKEIEKELSAVQNAKSLDSKEK